MPVNRLQRGQERRTPRLTEHPAFAPSLLLTIAIGMLGAAFNLGVQWNRQDRIAEITADLKERDSLLPARVMKDRYDFYERLIQDMQGRITALAVADASLRGEVKDVAGRGDAVWTRQAQDQHDISDIRANFGARLSALEARLDMLARQVTSHEEHDFQSERGEAHPK